MQLALCTGEHRDRASRAWKVVGQIKERVVLPEVRNWHGKGSCCGKLTQCCHKASWQCFERRRWLSLASTSLLHQIDRGFALLGCACCAEGIPTLLKMEFEGGGVVLKFHFKVPFLQSCFLNDQYSSSFHVIGKQVKIKYLRLAPEELSTCQTEAAHV